MNVVQFTVHGKPATAGSKRAFAYVGKDGKPHANVAPDNKRQKPFMAAVATEAAEAANGTFWNSDALYMVVGIYRTRPASHYRTGKNATLLKGTAPAFPSTKPDSLKVVRAIEDALKGVLYRDDSQICGHRIDKRFGTSDCVKVRIMTLDGFCSTRGSDDDDANL